MLTREIKVNRNFTRTEQFINKTNIDTTAISGEVFFKAWIKGFLTLILEKESLRTFNL